MNTKILATIASLVLIVPALGAPATGPADAWSDEVRGLRCRLTIADPRPRYHPGEFLALAIALRNNTQAALSVVNDAQACKLHLVTPDERELIWGAPLSSAPRSEPARSLEAGQEIAGVQPHFRLIEQPRGLWDTPKPRDISLSTPGQYRLWIVYDVPPGNDGDDQSWTGRLITSELLFTVEPIQPADRLDKPTPNQLADISAIQQGGPKSKPAAVRLDQALLRAENDGLAQHLVELVRQEPRWRLAFLPMLNQRAGDGLNPATMGIDGPYLASYASFILDCLAAPGDLAAAPAGLALDRRSYLTLGPVVAYVCHHPEEKVIRQRLLDLVGKNARPPGPATRPTTERPDNPRERAEAASQAWRILLRTGILHDGITLERATQILGFPTSSAPDSVSWYVNTRMHVNPNLVARLDNGQLSGFQISVR